MKILKNIILKSIKLFLNALNEKIKLFNINKIINVQNSKIYNAQDVQANIVIIG